MSVKSKLRFEEMVISRTIRNREGDTFLSVKVGFTEPLTGVEVSEASLLAGLRLENMIQNQAFLAGLLTEHDSRTNVSNAVDRYLAVTKEKPEKNGEDA